MTQVTDKEVLAVKCPTCGAMVGNLCKAPGGLTAKHFHAQRNTAAREAKTAAERKTDGWISVFL